MVLYFQFCWYIISCLLPYLHHCDTLIYLAKQTHSIQVEVIPKSRTTCGIRHQLLVFLEPGYKSQMWTHLDTDSIKAWDYWKTIASWMVNTVHLGSFWSWNNKISQNTIQMFASSMIDGEKRGEREKRRICAQPHFIKRTSRTAQSQSSSSLFFFPRGKLQLAPAFHPFTSRHCSTRRQLSPNTIINSNYCKQSSVHNRSFISNSLASTIIWPQCYDSEVKLRHSRIWNKNWAEEGAKNKKAYPFIRFIKNNSTCNRHTGLICCEVLVNVINVCYIWSQSWTAVKHLWNTPS
jgi:hypothetical protein